MRILIAGLLLVAGCTAHPVSAPPTSSTPSTSPAPSPTYTNDPSYVGCADVVPSDLVTEILGVTTPGAWESGSGDMIGCQFATFSVQFAIESSAEVFAQRRDRHLASGFVHVKELPDFYDEAYQFSVGAESELQTTIAARQGSAEVWVRWRTAPIMNIKDELFAAIFERLG